MSNRKKTKLPKLEDCLVHPIYKRYMLHKETNQVYSSKPSHVDFGVPASAIHPYPNRHGYYRFTIRDANGKQKTYYLHHFIWECHHGMNRHGKELDHIDRDRSHNSIDNLRLVDPSINHQNRTKDPSCTSKYRGVSWNSRTKRWQAQSMVDKVHVYLGAYKKEIDAARIYDEFNIAIGRTAVNGISTGTMSPSEAQRLIAMTKDRLGSLKPPKTTRQAVRRRIKKATS